MDEEMDARYNAEAAAQRRLEDEALAANQPQPAQRKVALDEGDIPRYAIKLQDNQTGFAMAVGANDLKAFVKTDLHEFIRVFKRRTMAAQKAQEAAAKGNAEV